MRLPNYLDTPNRADSHPRFTCLPTKVQVGCPDSPFWCSRSVFRSGLLPLLRMAVSKPSCSPSLWLLLLLLLLEKFIMIVKRISCPCSCFLSVWRACETLSLYGLCCCLLPLSEIVSPFDLPDMNLRLCCVAASTGSNAIPHHERSCRLRRGGARLFRRQAINSCRRRAAQSIDFVEVKSDPTRILQRAADFGKPDRRPFVCLVLVENCRVDTKTNSSIIDSST